MRCFWLCLACLLPCLAQAATRSVELTMQYETVSLAGKPVRAVTVNGQIPGPALHFTEGDTVEITVHNRLGEPGAIHWHGILVPWRMDGVPWVSMPPIPPGGSFTYRFPLRQTGTYWYHAHSKLHEQQGLYGAFIVEPQHETIKADRDITIMLSDWSNTDPEVIYHNLKKDGDYYKRWRPSWQFFIRSWQEAANQPLLRQEILKQGRAMESMRMGNWDWSDVAYDAFLLNGQPPSHPFETLAKPGERIRLRIINGGASTYFNVKLAGVDHFDVVAADGQDVEPVTVSRMLMGMAETYDILFTMPETPVAVYAEALDRSGAAMGILGQNPGNIPIPSITPFNDPMFTPGSPDHGSMDMGKATNMDMARHDHHSMDMDMPMESPMAMDMPAASIPPGELDYTQLRSLVPTNDPRQPVETIRLDLTGNMERYVWSFNNVRYQDAQPIEFVAGKTYRFILTNTTMMHHPIHIHGHWFILENGQGAYSPRKHTIDVPPMQTVTALVTAQESGHWFFHCHNLYHMMAGMTREIHYQEYPQP